MGADNGASEHGEVFDLDALERADTKEAFAFTAGGRTFRLATPDDLDWHAQTVFQEGDITKILPLLLGDDWSEFDQLDIPGWKLDQLMIAWGRHNGIDVGELEASSTSSKPKVGPSRRTSRRTTASGSRTSRRAG